MATTTGNRIRETIQRRQREHPEKYAPKAIAERLGVHLVTIYKWEAGTKTPGIENLQRLAADLNVAIEDLLLPAAPVG